MAKTTKSLWCRCPRCSEFTVEYRTDGLGINFSITPFKQIHLLESGKCLRCDFEIPVGSDLEPHSDSRKIIAELKADDGSDGTVIGIIEAGGMKNIDAVIGSGNVLPKKKKGRTRVVIGSHNGKEEKDPKPASGTVIGTINIKGGVENSNIIIGNDNDIS